MIVAGGDGDDVGESCDVDEVEFAVDVNAMSELTTGVVAPGDDGEIITQCLAMVGT